MKAIKPVSATTRRKEKPVGVVFSAEHGVGTFESVCGVPCGFGHAFQRKALVSNN